MSRKEEGWSGDNGEGKGHKMTKREYDPEMTNVEVNRHVIDAPLRRKLFWFVGIRYLEDQCGQKEKEN